MSRLSRSASVVVISLGPAAFGMEATFADSKTYCPIPDFIDVCLKQDESGRAIGKRMAGDGWSTYYSMESEPGYVGVRRKGSALGFSIREISYSDSFTQHCEFEYWRVISHGVKAYCSDVELDKLEDWANKNSVKLIAESHSPKPELPRFIQKGLNKFWKQERGKTRTLVKLGADEFDKGKPLVTHILSAQKTFLVARKNQP